MTSPVLTGRRDIAAFLGISVNSLAALIDAGLPVRVVGTIYIADKLALRQWLGVQVYPKKAGRLGRTEIDQIVEQVTKELSRRLAG
jgi:hypothetical protein